MGGGGSVRGEGKTSPKEPGSGPGIEISRKEKEGNHEKGTEENPPGGFSCKRGKACKKEAGMVGVIRSSMGGEKKKKKGSLLQRIRGRAPLADHGNAVPWWGEWGSKCKIYPRGGRERGDTWKGT